MQLELFHECNDSIGWQPFSKLFSLDALLDFAALHNVSIVTEVSEALQASTWTSWCTVN